VTGSRRDLNVGGLIFGAILLLVGIYYLLRNTVGFDLPELNWDVIWPIIVIAIGLGIVYGVYRSRQGPSA
jgi:uncharacterized integral membrane protein